MTNLTQQRPARSAPSNLSNSISQPSAARLRPSARSILLAGLMSAAGTAFISTQLSAKEASMSLNESTIIEVVNEVKVLSGDEMEAKPAEPEMRFQAPDFLQTGRRSRVRLEAEDGTVTRVGANTLFSFEETDRNINLKKGSLLFHSPSGRGGGRIVTASATASVVGTTITVTATEDGGFKLLVLEGTAKVTFPNGEIRILEAGQMTFVLPSEKGAVVQKGGAGEPGPILNFDLKRLRDGSRLLNGFREPLPSDPTIDQMIRRQQSRIDSGELKKTGARIVKLQERNGLVLETSEEDLITSSKDVRDHNLDPKLERLRIATESELTPQTEGFKKEKHFFPAPGFPIPDGFVHGLKGDELAEGIIAGRLNFIDDPLNEGFFDISDALLETTSEELELELERYFFRATDRLLIDGSLFISGMTGTAAVGFSALNTLNFTEGSSLGFQSEFPVFFRMDVANGPLDLNAAMLAVDQGTINLMSGRDLIVRGGSNIRAGFGDFYYFGQLEPIDGGTGEIQSPNSISLDGQNLEIRDSDLVADSSISARATNQITVDASALEAQYVSFEGGQITLSALDSFASSLTLTGEDRIDFSNSDLTSVASVNMAARTLVLSDIQFSSESNIQLGSERGLLAANPNTGASAVSGYVNFIQNVTLDGQPAQNFVLQEQGGQATEFAPIEIYVTGDAQLNR
ncbi:MAG: FecR domain-containing protein [Opitutales bacterium]